MIHLTTSQTFVASLYIIVFALVMAVLLHASDPGASKTSKHYWVYVAGIVIVSIVFLAIGDAVLGIAAHIKASAFILVTLKFNPQQNRYLNHGADKITDDEAVMLAAYFDANTPIDGYYEYNLIDDKSNMRRFNCMKPDLLGFIKATHTPKPVVPLAKKEIQTTEPAENNIDNDQQQDNE